MTKLTTDGYDHIIYDAGNALHFLAEAIRYTSDLQLHAHDRNLDAVHRCLINSSQSVSDLVGLLESMLGHWSDLSEIEAAEREGGE